MHWACSLSITSLIWSTKINACTNHAPKKIIKKSLKKYRKKTMHLPDIQSQVVPPPPSSTLPSICAYYMDKTVKKFFSDVKDIKTAREFFDKTQLTLRSRGQWLASSCSTLVDGFSMKTSLRWNSCTDTHTTTTHQHQPPVFSLLAFTTSFRQSDKSLYNGKLVMCNRK